MTDQEKTRKNKARKLINLPVSQRPDNVHYKPESRFDHAHYMVQFDDIGVFFLHDGKRLYYLGEYPPENFN